MGPRLQLVSATLVSNRTLSFLGDGDGMVPMKEGEEMLVMERDAGDGWTKVRKEKSKDEGFVPTSYVECKFYPED